MNNRERDLMWKDIMERYISDDCTLVKTKETKDGVILAIAGIEHGEEYLDIFVGSDYLMVFSISGYLEGLLVQGEEYWEEWGEFNEEELQEIREMYKVWSWKWEAE